MSARSTNSSATLTDEQSAARELVRSWAAGSRAVEGARDVEQGDPDAWRPAYDGLAQLGTFGVALPEEHGGADGTVADLCAMLDEAAAAMVPGPVASTAVATLVLSDSHAELLEALASGEGAAGVALSADLTYSDGRVSGTAEYVLGGSAGGVMLLPAGDTWVLVDAAADGVTVTALDSLDTTRSLGSVTLRGVAVPQDRVLRGAARNARTVWRILTAAEAVGVGWAALQMAVEYAKVREQFGRTIGTFQAVKHHAANMLVDVEVATAATWDAARADDLDSAWFAGAVAAALAIRAQVSTTQNNIQLHGGIGYTWESGSHAYLKRAALNRSLFGSPAAHRKKLAQRYSTR